jgi:hypothetical protein
MARSGTPCSLPRLALSKPKCMAILPALEESPGTIAGAVRAFTARKEPWFLINQLVFWALAIWPVFAIAPAAFRLVPRAGGGSRRSIALREFAILRGRGEPL